MSLNEVRIQGGITREPDMGFGAATGTPYWKTTLAVNGTRYDAQTRQQVVTTTFVSVIAFGWKSEQIMEEALGRGDELFVRGELDQSSYENKEKGTKEHSTKVRIESYDVVRRAGSRQSAPQTGAAARPDVIDDPWAAPAPKTQDTEPPF